MYKEREIKRKRDRKKESYQVREIERKKQRYKKGDT